MTNQEIQELAGHREVPPWVMKLVGEAVAAEREECAKVCEINHYTIKRNLDSFECARAIRARGQE